MENGLTLTGIALRPGDTRVWWKGVSASQLPPPAEVQSDVGVAATHEREAELTQWLAALPAEVAVWRCSWNDAALAGAFSGQPGVLLLTDHWGVDLREGCSQVPGDQLFPNALALAREPAHRTVPWTSWEGSDEWLAREAAAMLGEVSEPSRSRLTRELSALLAQPESSPDRHRALNLRNRLDALADYPGPDPACLELLARCARRLSDLLRRLTGRCRLPAGSPWAWSGGPVEGPLLQALLKETERYLPQFRPILPEGDAARGAASLVQGARAELQRQALRPGVSPADLQRQGVQPVTADAWRQLSRLKLR